MSELAILSRDWNQPVSGFSALESRSSLENPQSPISYPSEWLLDIFNGGRTDAGIRVNEMMAFQMSTFLACTDIIGGKISSFPRDILEVTKAKNDRRGYRIADDHEYADMLSLEPNPEMNGNVMFRAMLYHVVAWSNAYLEIQRDEGNAAIALWPRNPARTRPHRLLTPVVLPPAPWRPFQRVLQAGTMCYMTTDGMDKDQLDATSQRPDPNRIIPAEDMIHLIGPSFDGRIGYSTVQLIRQVIGWALAMEKFGSSYFRNYARPGGILIMPANMKPDTVDAAKKSWMEAQGGENSNRTAVLGPGWDWKQTTSNPQDAQTVESRREARREVCAVLHVPPHMVGDPDQGKASTEQRAQELIEYCFRPWMSLIRMEFKRKLFGHRGIGRAPRNPYWLEFDITDFVRADAQSREKFYSGGRQWSYLCVNDVRAFEKLSPIDEPWAEQHHLPINMTLTTTPVDPTFQDGAGKGEVPPGGTGGSGTDPNAPPPKTPPKGPAKKPKATAEYLAIAYRRSFHAAYAAVTKRDRRDLALFMSAFSPTLYSIRDIAFMDAVDELDVKDAHTAHADTDRFITQYIGSMHKRGQSWKADDAEMRSHELLRAVQAIRGAAYREAAALKAEELTGDVDVEEETDGLLI